MVQFILLQMKPHHKTDDMLIVKIYDTLSLTTHDEVYTYLLVFITLPCHCIIHRLLLFTFLCKQQSTNLATFKERKGQEEYLYGAFIQRLVSRRSDMDHTVLPANYTMPAFPS